MNWGVIGYGEIAPAFIEGIGAVAGQELVAIATISNQKALTDEPRHQSTKIYPTYGAILDDPIVDAVYICTTNQLHKELVCNALRAGKSVLCEKPLGVCKPDVVEMVEEARIHGKFLMEGMWTRFLPSYKHFQYILENGFIGNVGFVQVDFGFVSQWDSKRRLRNRELYGGTILDNADYGVFLSQDVHKVKPSKISAFARFCDTGVDDLCGVMLQYPNGSISQLFSSFHLQTTHEATIYGEFGYVRLRPFWNGTVVALVTSKGEKTWSFPFRKNGFEYEIEEVVKCVKNDQIESKIVPHDLSIEIAGIMDEIIEQVEVNE